MRTSEQVQLMELLQEGTLVIEMCIYLTDAFSTYEDAYLTILEAIPAYIDSPGMDLFPCTPDVQTTSEGAREVQEECSSSSSSS